MSKQITMDYYGMSGTGATVKEAKADASRKLQAAMEGDYLPYLLTLRDEMAIVARDPVSGWGYRLIHSDRKPVTECWLNQGYGDSRDEVMLNCARHLIDNVRQVGDTFDNSPDLTAFIDALPGRKIATELRRWSASDWARSDEFQTRYRQAVAMGLSSLDCHDYAGRNPMRPELWNEEAAAA